MHTLALQLAPVIAAEKSKVPFYIAGGLLVAWALLLSLGIGLRRSDFPSNVSQQRMVVAITGVLVLAAVGMAVLTSGGATSSVAAGSSTTSTATETAPPSTSSSTQPTATTGTPKPPSSPAPPAASLKLAANPEGQLSYDTKSLSTKAGSVTIAFTNASPLEHNVTIAQGSRVLGATPSFAGGSKRLTLALKPGKYTFYCSVPGHRQAGMEGTLTVS
jgi:uncharacterized cupredoxin-like copper-binding protein